MTTRNSILSALVLVSLLLLGKYLLPVSYNTYMVTWSQPTEDPRPVRWPVNYPYWTKGTYPITGYHQITAVIKGTKESVLESITTTYPEACMLQITLIPYFQLPSNWVYPEWWSANEWNIKTTKPQLN